MHPLLLFLVVVLVLNVVSHFHSLNAYDMGEPRIATFILLIIASAILAVASSIMLLTTP